MECLGCLHTPVDVRFSGASCFGPSGEEGEEAAEGSGEVDVASSGGVDSQAKCNGCVASLASSHHRFVVDTICVSAFQFARNQRHKNPKAHRGSNQQTQKYKPS